MDCGPVCLKMIFNYYGMKISDEAIRQACGLTKDGVSLLGLAEAAEKFGLSTLGVRLTLDRLVSDAILPCIVHWENYHYVVLTPDTTSDELIVADPGVGLVTFSRAEFSKKWQTTKVAGIETGAVLLICFNSNLESWKPILV
jgi:ATP-binding cassette subfamily B protein